jgi:hypothetical protein
LSHFDAVETIARIRIGSDVTDGCSSGIGRGGFRHNGFCPVESCFAFVLFAIGISLVLPDCEEPAFRVPCPVGGLPGNSVETGFRTLVSAAMPRPSYFKGCVAGHLSHQNRTSLLPAASMSVA